MYAASALMTWHNWGEVVPILESKARAEGSLHGINRHASMAKVSLQVG